MESQFGSGSHDQWTLIRGARQLLTLRGSSGPRRGSAFNEIHPINDGALLIRNGIVEEAGPARRVENLAPARKAREIDASRKIIMPAFADPDGALVFSSAARLRVISRRVLETDAMALAAERVRYGTLTLGAHTASALDFRENVKVLRINATLQNKPLRIRSIVAPVLESADDVGVFEKKLLPLVRQRKLASIVELNGSGHPALIKAAAIAAASRGFSMRIRFTGETNPELLALAVQAGAVAILGLPTDRACMLSASGIPFVLPAFGPITECANYPALTRLAIANGIPLALGSGYGGDGERSCNPQYLLHLAMERFGLTCEEAIMAATYNAACSLKMSHVTGSLEQGKSADLVIMDVPDYRDLPRRVGHNDVFLTLRSGIPVYRRAAVTAPVADVERIPVSGVELIRRKA